MTLNGIMTADVRYFCGSWASGKSLYLAYVSFYLSYRVLQTFNKKLRCREEHNSSVVLSWCT